MKFILTAPDAGIFHRIAVPAQELPDNAGLTEIDVNVQYQTLLGFGGAFTESAAVTLFKMGEKNRQKILDAYFRPHTGAGYSLGRIAIASCDFAEGVYEYIAESDLPLKNLDISHEDKFVFPMLAQAEKTLGGAISLLASPWSPPAFMKSNKDRKHGGTLLPEFYEQYAQYLILFIKEAKKRDAQVEWLSVQNEPEAVQTWDSCIYSPEQERDFVKNHLGPALKNAGLTGVKLLIHDHNRDNLLPRALPILNDPEAARYIWGTAIHWYVSEDFAAETALHEAHPSKHLLFTEGCIEGGPAPGARGSGERYARNIIGDLNNWTEGWIDWNLLLDAKGGPNHVGNYCCAPILCDTEKDTFILNPSYHYIAHFSRYIQPGGKRVAHTEGNPALKTLAAQNPDGSLVLAALNETDFEQPLVVAASGNRAAVALPPHSICTVVV